MGCPLRSPYAERLRIELSQVKLDSHNINRSAASFDCSSSPQLCCCPMVVLTTPDGSQALSSMFNSTQRLVSATAHPQQYVRAPFNLAPHSALRHRRHPFTLVGMGGCLIHTVLRASSRDVSKATFPCHERPGLYFCKVFFSPPVDTHLKHRDARASHPFHGNLLYSLELTLALSPAYDQTLWGHT